MISDASSISGSGSIGELLPSSGAPFVGESAEPPAPGPERKRHNDDRAGDLHPNAGSRASERLWERSVGDPSADLPTPDEPVRARRRLEQIARGRAGLTAQHRAPPHADESYSRPAESGLAGPRPADPEDPGRERERRREDTAGHPQRARLS